MTTLGKEWLQARADLKAAEEQAFTHWFMNFKKELIEFITYGQKDAAKSFTYYYPDQYKIAQYYKTIEDWLQQEGLRIVPWGTAYISDIQHLRVEPLVSGDACTSD